MTVIAWRQQWREIFGEEPFDATSREVSVQEALAALIAGEPTEWFTQYEPSEQGRVFLRALRRAGFGHVPLDDIDWFVSEYELPVPVHLRADIPFTYRCPDFAFGSDSRVAIFELKTESGSYRARQMIDYLTLVRVKHPGAFTDVALLAPHRPGATPGHDARQRYAEVTWAEVPALLTECFPASEPARHLAEFVTVSLVGRGATDTPSRDTDGSQLIAAAVAHALRIAPSVASASRDDAVERGIDIALPSLEAARRAQAAVRDAVNAAGYEAELSVWLWQPSSMGVPATPAGNAMQRELRLAPRFAARG